MYFIKEIILRKILKLFGLDNSEKIIYELMSNPGSGKSSIINFYSKFNNEIKSSPNKSKSFKSFNKKNFLLFLIKNPLIIIYTAISFYKISNNFIHPNIHNGFIISLKRKIKIYKILLLMWFQIKETKSVKIVTESLLHQILRISDNKQSLIKSIVLCYGSPRLSIIFIDTPIKTSIQRMYLRGDKIKINDKRVLQRYKNTLVRFEEIFKYTKNNHKQTDYLIKPLLLHGINSVQFNYKILKSHIDLKFK